MIKKWNILAIIIYFLVAILLLFLYNFYPEMLIIIFPLLFYTVGMGFLGTITTFSNNMITIKYHLVSIILFLDDTFKLDFKISAARSMMTIIYDNHKFRVLISQKYSSNILALIDISNLPDIRKVALKEQVIKKAAYW